MCLLVLKHASAEYATNAFSSKEKYEKSLWFMFSKQRRIWSFHVVVLQQTAKKCTKNYNARARLLFCSLNLLIGDVLVAVAVVFFVRSLISTGVGHYFAFYQKLSLNFLNWVEIKTHQMNFFYTWAPMRLIHIQSSTRVSNKLNYVKAANFQH